MNPTIPYTLTTVSPTLQRASHAESLLAAPEERARWIACYYPELACRPVSWVAIEAPNAELAEGIADHLCPHDRAFTLSPIPSGEPF